MIDADVEGVAASLVSFSTLIGCLLLVLIGPCGRFSAHVEAQTTTSSELREEKWDFREGDVPETREQLAAYVLQELLGNDTGPGVHRKFHLADFLVDLLHEVDDEIHQLVFVHLLRVEVGNQEANIISLQAKKNQEGVQT